MRNEMGQCSRPRSGTSRGRTSRFSCATVSTYEALLRKIRCGAGVTSSSKEIYTAKCAVCHGERGDGKGPAGLALPLQPPDLGDRDMIAQMRDNYWFRRV